MTLKRSVEIKEENKKRKGSHMQAEAACAGTLVTQDMPGDTLDFRSISESVADLMCVHNRDGSFAHVSLSLSTMLGCAPSELLGRSLYDCVHPEDYEKVLKPYFAMVQDGLATKGTLEFRYRKSNRKYLWVEAHFTPVASDGSPAMYVLSALRDNTERRYRQEVLKKYLENLRSASQRVVDILVMAVETRNSFTNGHQRRVAALAFSIAQTMGLSQDKTENLRIASAMHDIGKIMIPLEILNAPRRLTHLEYELVKTHAEMGYDILKDLDFSYPVADMILQHHERLDGSGYPNRLIGEEILIEAKIMMVADVVEAMTSKRSYRASFGTDVALEAIIQRKGILYDADAVDACVELFRKIGFKFT